MTPRHLLHALLLLPLSACTSNNEPSTRAPTAPIASGRLTGTLLALETRDRSCWVRVLNTTGDGSYEGDIELCPGGRKDASGLIGKAVTTTSARVRVPAVACKDNVNCEEAAWVDVVVTISAAP